MNGTPARRVICDYRYLEGAEFTTRAVHAGQNPDQWASGVVVPPIHLGTTFKQDAPGKHRGFEYGRSGNPSRACLEYSLASLDEAKHGLAFSSGLAAVTAICALLESGDHIVSGEDVYGGTNRYFRTVGKNHGLTVDFVDATVVESIVNAIKPNTKGSVRDKNPVSVGDTFVQCHYVHQAIGPIELKFCSVMHSHYRLGENYPGGKVIIRSEDIKRNVRENTGKLLQPRSVLARKPLDHINYDFNYPNFDDELAHSFCLLVWVENPTNPLLRITDIPRLAQKVKAINDKIIIVVDNTFLTPYLQRPLQMGADIAMYSLTKYMNGHSDVIMGAVTLDSDELNEKMLIIQNSMGLIPSPFDCYLVNRSLKTLAIRMDRHIQNATAVAAFLEKHPAVESVIFPGAKSHPQYELAKRLWNGPSGMISFYIRGGLKQSTAFLKALRIFILAESLGGFESLAELPSVMTHASVPLAMRDQLKITDNLIRLSIGLESSKDLIKDLSQALEAATAVSAT